MKVFVRLAVIAALGLITGSVAQAEVFYPYCSEGRGGSFGSGATNCGFVSMAQCEASARSNGEWCHVNPAYAPRDDYGQSPPRRVRR